jgi:hypothetical protein
VAEQRWFAGVPVVERRQLDASECERLRQLVRAVTFESLGSYGILVVATACAVVASTISVASGWLGPIVLSVTSGMLRYVPQRRFFSPRVILRLRRDLSDRAVEVCQTEEVRLEVLTASHIIWTRNGAPPDRPIVAHGTTTALPPPHAAMAAEFVRPAEDGTPIYIHQRTLTSDEVAELDSYAPRPLFAAWVLASVGVLGAVLTFALALAGRLTTLLPPFVFLVIGLWAAISVFRSRRARQLIAADIEAAFVLIIRGVENDELGAPEEFLPFSRFLWTRNGQPAEWRTRIRRYQH